MTGFILSDCNTTLYTFCSIFVHLAFTVACVSGDDICFGTFVQLTHLLCHIFIDICAFGQLLDMMHDLHTRAAGIFTEWAEEAEVEVTGSLLWERAWCPLLQGCARLCCDVRRQVRKQALTVLTRALLAVDLQQRMSSIDWEACFNKVLFPLLTSLLETANPVDPAGMEETLHRAATLLTKVFLQHLTPLVSLSTFTALWLTILDFMDRYMHAITCSDLLVCVFKLIVVNCCFKNSSASIYVFSLKPFPNR